MQAYSDPSRESDPHALPDIEVFFLTVDEAREFRDDCGTAGWFWWSCLPGCLPDSDPIGPFATKQEALDDAQSFNE